MTRTVPRKIVFAALALLALTGTASINSAWADWRDQVSPRDVDRLAHLSDSRDDALAQARTRGGSGDFRAASQPFGVLTEKTDGVNETVVREQTGNRSLVLFDSGDEVTVQAGDKGVRFLLVSGKPIEEPVAWHGPIVMNSQAELQQAFTELRQGTFIR